MRSEYYIPTGFIKKFYDNKNREHLGLFSFSKLLKKLLKRFGISFYDDCCPVDEADRTALPVRYNEVEAQLERYDPDTKAWVAVS